MSKEKELPDAADLERTVEDIAAEVERLSLAMNKLANSRLKRRALVVLIHDACPGGTINKGQIEMVLDKAADLKKLYIK